MPSYRIDLAWDGSAYSGWQVQPNQDTIQGRVERALHRIFDGENIRVMAAGRTDAGVHALQQIVSFTADKERRESDVQRGLNGLLPKDISCILAEKMEDGFQARYATKEKMYRYRILHRKNRCPFRYQQTWHYGQTLDVDRMKEAAALLEGTYDFAGFRARGCTASHTWRTLKSCTVHHEEDEIHIEAIGNGFLRHQVRIMTGTLVLIGSGRKKLQLIEDILLSGDRSLGGQTAPPQGLWLVWTRLDQNRVDQT